MKSLKTIHSVKFEKWSEEIRRNRKYRMYYTTARSIPIYRYEKYGNEYEFMVVEMADHVVSREEPE